MISRLGLWISRVFQRTCPDPFVLVVLLTVVTAILALSFGTFPGQPGATLGQRAAKLLDDWNSDRGLWKFLAFSMQMCLVLLTGHALAATRPIRAMIGRLASVPRNTAQAAAMVGLVASATALVNWGMGLVVGALLARDVGRSMARRGAPCHYPLIAAAGYMGLLLWHGGISGSAPLSMTTLVQAKRVLPAELVESKGSAILVGLDRTLLSPLNLFVTGGLLVLIPIVLYLLAPKSTTDIVPFDRCSSLPLQPTAAEDQLPEDQHCTIPDKLDRSPVLAWLIAIPLLLGLWRYLMAAGWQAIGLSDVIAFMLALGLLLHGSLKRYAAAVEHGASDCVGIVIQFPLYGGILVMMQTSGLAEQFSSWMTSHASPRTLPLLMFLAASVLNMFITSGGGLWGVMGPIALTTGETAGVAPEKMVMAVAYGDQVTNMLQPFWALPLLAITGVKARDIVGYTCVVMLAAYVWISLGLLLF